jgi:hypothetical protein
MAKPKGKTKGAEDENRQFDLAKALEIAKDATLFAGVKSETTLEDAKLRTPEERELYALRVIGSVAHEHFKLKKTQVPQKATTEVNEVASAIVIFAS